MADVTGTIGVKAFLDLGHFERGMAKFGLLTDKASVKTGELGNVFKMVARPLDIVLKSLAGIGVGLLTAFTGFLAVSPQMRAGIARLRKPLFDLSNFLGKQFKSSIDAGVNLFRRFVDVLRADPEVGKFLTGLNEKITDFVNSIDETKINRFVRRMSFLSKVVVKPIKLIFESPTLTAATLIGLAAALAATGHPLLAAGLLTSTVAVGAGIASNVVAQVQEAGETMTPEQSKQGFRDARHPIVQGSGTLTGIADALQFGSPTKLVIRAGTVILTGGGPSTLTGGLD